MSTGCCGFSSAKVLAMLMSTGVRGSSRLKCPAGRWVVVEGGWGGRAGRRAREAPRRAAACAAAGPAGAPARREGSGGQRVWVWVCQSCTCVGVGEVVAHVVRPVGLGVDDACSGKNRPCWAPGRPGRSASDALREARFAHSRSSWPSSPGRPPCPTCASLRAWRSALPAPVPWRAPAPRARAPRRCDERAAPCLAAACRQPVGA